MKFEVNPGRPATRARGRCLLAALFAALTLAACGGGGDAASPNAQAPGAVSAPGAAPSDTLSQGVITGFGSIIVNGVRYDDSAALVSDEDDEENPSRGRNDLKLGMVVTVSGVSGTGTGSASAIAFGSMLKGPVQSINGSTVTASVSVAAGTQTLVILGQTVVVGARAIFDPLSLPGGFADIRKGDALEVHGHLDVTANRMIATRINPEANASVYKITGNVSSLSASSRTFKIGPEVISYATIDPGKLRVNLANGVTVKVQLSSVQTSPAIWNATRIKPASRKAMENRSKVEIEGLIDAFTSASQFSINGVPVDARNARFPKGPGSLALGARVEVKGSIVGGTLVATQVKVEEDDDEDNKIELNGVISGVNTSARTFELRGLTVSYAGSVKFEHGTESKLVNGAKVEVKGRASPGGSTIQAQKIEFEG